MPFHLLFKPVFGLLMTFILVGAGSACQESSESDTSVDCSTVLGDWTGALDIGAVRLHLVFHIKSDQETLVATLDSLDQGALGIALDQVDFDGTTIRVESKKMQAVFTGRLHTTGDHIEGTWNQRGREFPLLLNRSLGTSVRQRPQTPRPPFAYQVEDVTYPHLVESFSLAATLTSPTVQEPAPAVILISGSGAQDRDETIFDHKPFAVLADHLTKAGLVVLRVDDRGVGGSGNDLNPEDDTTRDYATDVRSSLAYLRTRPEVDSQRIGLIGHSEGSIIAAMVAADDPKIAFLILLAGPGVSGDELLLLQSEKIARASGADEVEVKRLNSLQGQIFSLIRNQPDIDLAKIAAREILITAYAQASEEERKSIGSEEAFVAQHASIISNPWFRHFLTFDPGPVLARVTCPVLALTGSKDLQVPPEQNLPKIRQWLTHLEPNDVVVKELPDLNHLLQTAKTGLVTEYGEIEETFSPVALKEIVQWLKQRKLIQ
jgi:hypothetical protein